MACDIQNFINGEFVPPESGAYIDNICPGTGRPFGKVPDSGAADMEKAVHAAEEAFPLWSGTTAENRSRILLRIAELVEQRLDEFAQAESRDNGKPVSLARRVDIPRVVWNFRFFATAILHTTETSTTLDGPIKSLNYTLRTPLGVAGLISPWNLPLYLLSWKIAPAIAVGNTCVCKPSEFTSLTAWMLCQVMNEAGLPRGVVNMVFGDGPKAGSVLVSHPRVPIVSFTGGTKTGELVRTGAAALCKKLSLELGGKNPTVIFADADLDEAVPTSVRSSFANQGEICLCGSRIFVEESILDKFLPRFIEGTKKLKVGDANAADTDLGALVSAQHRDKVLSYIRLAREEGGTIVCGGDEPVEGLADELKGGYYVRPTVITGLGPHARCNLEEIFGPVVTIIPFKSEEEVIGMSNVVRYGLAASVWTQNVKRAHNVAARLRAGTVWVNCWLVRDLRVPFGGQKESGVGFEGGEHSIDFYTELKTVCVKL